MLDIVEYKTLLEELLSELRTVLKTCTYMSQRKRKIKVSERLEAVKSVGYLTQSIQYVCSSLQDVNKKIEEMPKPKEPGENDYDVMLILEREEVITITDRERLKNLLGVMAKEESSDGGGQDQKKERQGDDSPS